MPVVTLVDQPTKLVSLLNWLQGLPADPPSLYVDLEGVNLGRYGTVSIISIYAAPLDIVYLVDVHRLGAAIISITNPQGTSLKSLLECPNMPKVFFDVRNDSDALYSIYGIRLACVKDIQLMELASRQGCMDFVNSLAKCVESDSAMTERARAEFKALKTRGVMLFAPEHGGTYEVFNQRPLPRDLVEYCASDVATLADLYQVYSTRLQRNPRPSIWWYLVYVATLDRVRLSQSQNYDPNGKNKGRGPWNSIDVCEIRCGSWDERFRKGW